MELSLGLNMNAGLGAGDSRVVPVNVLQTDTDPVEDLLTDDTGEFLIGDD